VANSPLTGEYCQRYGVACIRMVEMPGVVDGADLVCNMTIEFDGGYQVEFKLPLRDTPAADGVGALIGNGELQVQEGCAGSDEDKLAHFFAGIESRLEKIQHEQSVQNIAYLGNTFILNNKTVFDVVADEDGKLTIEMHRGEERQAAMLLASSLLDGLYDGSIVLQN